MKVRVLLLGGLVLAGPALGQTVEEVVVTGRGLGPGLGEEVFDIVAIGRDRLANAPSNRLEDVLRDVAGFQLFRRSDSRSANPTSQGATLRALGGNASSRALLVLDGVPQTDPFGGWISWPAFDPRRLGNVRVVRGGGSGRNGPGALAGTIELDSAAPQEIAGAEARLAYGSRHSVDAYAGGSVPVGAGVVALSGSYARGRGFVPIAEGQRGAVDRPSPYEQASVSLRGIAPLAEGVELQASGLLFSDERERGTAFSGIVTRGADASLRLVGRRWSALAYLQGRDFYNSFASVGSGRASVTRASEQYSVPSQGLGARFEVRPRLGAVEFRLGGDWRQTEGRTQERFQFVAGAGTRNRVAGGRTTTMGGFGEIGWRSGNVTLTGGGRIDRWLIRQGVLRETAIATGQSITDVAYGDRSGWQPTARAGAAWRPMPNLTLRSAAYLGWRLPTLNELYRPFRVGSDATAANADLDPERLSGVEAGVELRPMPNASLSATIFSNRLEDGIANVTLGQGPGQFPGVGFVAGRFSRRQNLGAIVSRGVEVDGRLVSGSWTLTSAAALDGLRPAQTPRHSFTAAAAWSNAGGMRASLGARYVGSQFEDDLNLQLLSDALTFDAAASLPIAPGVEVELRAENIGDELVESAISTMGIVERATPRTVWIGLRVSR
jgi:outer membrane receptor protein involved in Fe transport